MLVQVGHHICFSGQAAPRLLLPDQCRVLLRVAHGLQICKDSRRLIEMDGNEAL